MSIYKEDEVFEGLDYTSTGFESGEYEVCTFRHCNFSNQQLRDSKFIECTFEECNLSNASFFKSSLQDVEFVACKMVGIPFDRCNTFGFEVRFVKSHLNHSVFFGVDLGRSRFAECQLEGVDFGEANLSGIQLQQCDFRDAIFDRTNLTKANLLGALNLVFDPENNQIKGAKINLETAKGLLSKYGLEIE